jgi:hypothetical protein
LGLGRHGLRGIVVEKREHNLQSLDSTLLPAFRYVHCDTILMSDWARCIVDAVDATHCNGAPE